MKANLWLRVSMVALGAFALGTDAFVVAGILQDIARQLGVTGATAGQLETVFSLTVAIGSPLLVALVGNVPPKRLLLFSLVLFVLSNIFAAVAPNFALLMVARVLAAIGVAIYTPVAAGTVASFAPPEARGRALGLVGTGMTSAIVLGVPLGILIGTHFSWRYTFVLVAVLGALAMIGILALVPAVDPPPEMGLAERLSFLRRPALLVMLLNVVIWMIGGYVLYSYLGLVLQNVTHLNGQETTLMFFWFGLTSIAGNFLGGIATDRWGVKRTLAVGIIGGGSGLVLVSLLGASLWGMAFALGLWSLAGWMLGAPQQHRLIAEAPPAAGVLLSLNGSAIYFGIGLGAALGGALLHAFPLSSLGWLGSLWEALALLVMLWSMQLASRKQVAPSEEVSSVSA